MIGPTIINATVEELTATCSGVSCDIQSDQPEECCKISWNEWYEWQGCRYAFISKINYKMDAILS